MMRLLYLLWAVLSLPVMYLTAGGVFWPVLVPAVMRPALANQGLESRGYLPLATLIGLVCFV